MEFKGVRLGPALKIVGYSSYLRAKSRILNMNDTPQQQQNNRNTPLQGDRSTPSQITPLHNKTVEFAVNQEVQIVPKATQCAVETVCIRNQPHHIEDDIPLHKNEDVTSEIEARPKIETNVAKSQDAENKGKECQNDNVAAPHMVEC